MTLLSLLAKELDKHSFLGFNIWDFSLHSLGQGYGKLFIQEAILKYPLKILEGLQRYNSLVRRGKQRGEIVNLTQGDWPDLALKIAAQGKESLVAVGYCQKPLDTTSQPGCPSGRFNHNCQFLEKVNLTKKKQPPFIACSTCSVRTIGLQALKLGLTFYIMTTAIDIGVDILIPTLTQQRYRFGLFFLCPYSAQALIFPLLTCRIEACLVKYQSGNCLDYAQFIAADQGNKPEQTQISPTTWGWWKKFVKLIEQQPRHGKPYRFTHFSLQENMLVPAEERFNRPCIGKKAGLKFP